MARINSGTSAGRPARKEDPLTRRPASLHFRLLPLCSPDRTDKKHRLAILSTAARGRGDSDFSR